MTRIEINVDQAQTHSEHPIYARRHVPPMTSDPFYEIRESRNVLFSSETLAECLAFARSYLMADRDRTMTYIYLCIPAKSRDIIAGVVQQVFDLDDGSPIISYQEYGSPIVHDVREDGSLGKPLQLIISKSKC